MIYIHDHQELFKDPPTIQQECTLLRKDVAVQAHIEPEIKRNLDGRPNG
jgi:hypothetical protein